MNANAYAIVSSVMRYFFLAALVYFIAVLLLRSISEYRYLREAQRLLRLAIRWVEVLEPACYCGKWFHLSEDTDIGSDADCEIPLKKTKLKPHHARITIKKGEYRFSTKQRRFAEINGQPLIRKETPLADGDTVWVQDVCFVCHKTHAEEGENA